MDSSPNPAPSPAPDAPADAPTVTAPPSDAGSLLANLLDGYLAELQAGRSPDRERLLAAHPELAEELRACLAGLDFIHQTARTDGPPAALGDFRIVREVGRGGMGVVYEAEQVSLRRRVALKVLRVAGLADAGALERFQREAETVAHLHHTNIVPIFAVGSEQGVHYYAMQFIDGRSLAEVVAAAPAEVTPASAVRWCQEAAEALAHAHQRGVIHRDVKPSNLLLDGEGRIWLTDFGLARRASEATLTQTGALMGTPRYMSPEQASSARLPIDHRTDVYSLGATLYELAAGQPVFEAETPHAILTKIVGVDPVPPRKLNPGLPRDLETIILKCLAKEPRDRYPSAQELADDLRRLASGDAIRARRPSLWERTRRWIRKRRQSVAVSTGTAVLAAVLAVAAVIGGLQHFEARKGSLTFSTLGPHFKAELLDTRGAPVGVSFTVPNEDPVRVEPGEYQLQLTRDGVLSETVQVSVDPASVESYRLDLSGREIFDQVAIPRNDSRNDGFAFLEAGGRTDLLLTGTQRGLRKLAPKQNRDRLIDGVAWEVSWHGWHPHFGEEHPGARGFGYTEPMLTTLNERRRLAVPPAHLTAKDRLADPVWAGTEGLLAVNGNDGKVLWHHPWRTTAPAPETETPTSDFAYATKANRPITRDLNGDGVSDFLCAVEAPHHEKRKDDNGKELKTITSRRWIAAVDGRDGRELWRRGFRSSVKPEVVMADELPVKLVSTASGEMLVALDGPQVLLIDSRTGRDFRPPAEAGDDAPTQLRPLDLDADAKLDALFWIAGPRLFALRLADGQPYPAFPVQLDFTPVGDVTLIPGPEPALLLIKETAQAQLELRCHRWGAGQPHWTRPIRAMWPQPSKDPWDSRPDRPATWPQLVGRWHDDPHRDVVVPDRFSRTKPEREDDGTVHIDLDDKSQYWAGISVLDADTGDLRWQRQLPADSEGSDYLQLDHFAAGDDLDGDGFRELYVASFGSSYRDAPGEGSSTHRFLYVTCFAGRDGRTLWWQRHPLRADSSAYIEPLQWWQAGPDGYPLLMVSYNADSSHNSVQSPSTTYFLQASTGRLEHVLAGVGQPQLVDLTGDGVLDLYSLVQPSPASNQFRGEPDPQLFTMQGTPPVAWRRLGQWHVTTDINGDGVADVLCERSDDVVLSAADGRTGERIWHTPELKHGSRSWTTLTLPEGDIDGDGVADAVSRSPLDRGVLSLKTGRLLWGQSGHHADLQGDSVGTSAGGRVLMGPVLLRPFSKDRPAIVYEYRLDFGSTKSTEMDQRTTQCWLAALDARTGAFLWRTPLGEALKDRYELVRTGQAVDLDGDGGDDLVVLSARETCWSVRGLRGRDGTILWTRDLANSLGPLPELLDEPPVLLVDKSATPPRILVVERDCPIKAVNKVDGETKVDFGESAHQVLALDLATGTPRTIWRGPATPPLTIGQTVRWSARALFAKLDAAGASLCVNLIRPRTDEGEHNFHHVFHDQVVIGPDLKVRSVQSHPTTVPWSTTLVMPSLHAADLDADGFDELVFGIRLDAGDAVFATKGGFDHARPFWKHVGRADGVEEIVPAGKGRDPLVVMYGDSTRRYALSGRTGEVLWNSWPGTRLPADGPDEPLRFLSTREELTTCYVGGATTPPARLPEAAVRFHPPPDPRLTMSVPWASWLEVEMALKASLYSLALIVLPLSLLRNAISRRWPLWGAGLVLWGLAVGLAYYWKWLPGAVTSFEEFFLVLSIMQILEIPLRPLVWVGGSLDLGMMRALLGLPVLGAGLALVISFRRGGWRGFVGLVIFNLVASAITAIVLLRVHQVRFDVHQYFDAWELPQLFLFGGYFVGLLTLALWLLRQLAVAGQKLRGLAGRTSVRLRQ